MPSVATCSSFNFVTTFSTAATLWVFTVTDPSGVIAWHCGIIFQIKESVRLFCPLAQWLSLSLILSIEFGNNFFLRVFQFREQFAGNITP